MFILKYVTLFLSKILEFAVTELTDLELQCSSLSSKKCQVFKGATFRAGTTIRINMLKKPPFF